jgi:hypothetical protein
MAQKVSNRYKWYKGKKRQPTVYKKYKCSHPTCSRHTTDTETYKSLSDVPSKIVPYEIPKLPHSEYLVAACIEHEDYLY